MGFGHILHIEVMILLGSLAAILSFRLLTRRIDLTGLLTGSATPGQVSPERVQLLLATLVLGGRYLDQALHSPGAVMPDVNKASLAVLGTSSGIYAVRKFLAMRQFNSQETGGLNATELSQGTQVMLTLCGYGVCLFVGVLGFMLLLKIWRNEIDLGTLLQETNGDASMSRFQLLIFTLVVAVSLFILVERTSPPAFPAIPDGVLWLLGISGSTYAVGKGISYSRPEGVTSSEERSMVRQTAAAISASGAAVDAQASEMVAGGAPVVDIDR